MKKLCFFLFLIGIFFNSKAQDTINVPADYSTIQAAIDTAKNGDIILVGKGIYVENINFKGKNIIVGSLFLTNNDTSYICQTIIDGNKSGNQDPYETGNGVVVFENGEDSTACLCGFTITNGKGGMSGGGRIISYWGGGITCNNSSPTLSNLKVIGNDGYCGGGIYFGNCQSKLINVTVTENTAKYGGGICFDMPYSFFPGQEKSSIPTFDTINCCNIFLNVATFGNDLYKITGKIISVILDTFTVINPTDYHAYLKDNFDFDIKNSKIPQVNSDLFVNPSGDNKNSGLSPNEPLKTVSFAMKKIYADSVNPKTIYLANGIYSTSNSGEFYPLGLLNYISLHGESEENVIFEKEGYDEIIDYTNNMNATRIENITLRGSGETRGIFIDNSNPELKNITMDGAMLWLSNANPIIENVKISGNTEEAGILMYGSSPVLMNVEINNNSGWLCGGIRIEEDSDPTLINVTISGNTGREMGGISTNAGSDPVFANTIVWNNSLPEIELRSFSNWNCSITFLHSNIQGGQNGIHLINYESGVSKINWLEGNINLNPLFTNAENGNFHLSASSPCIDAGIQDTMIIYNNGQDTLIIPTLVFIGSAPDIGAFEFDPSIDVKEIYKMPMKFRLEQNYPNPFNPTTIIKYSIPKQSFVTLKVYDILGQEIENLINAEKPAGNYQIEFNAANLPSGVYFYRIQAGSFNQVRKMLLIK